MNKTGHQTPSTTLAETVGLHGVGSVSMGLSGPTSSTSQTTCALPATQPSPPKCERDSNYVRVAKRKRLLLMEVLVRVD